MNSDLLICQLTTVYQLCTEDVGIIQKRPLSSHPEEVSIFPKDMLMKLDQLDPRGQVS